MSDPIDPRHAAAPAPRSSRGQSLVEFALLLPMLMVLFLGIADFGRVFAAGITMEAAARNAAEVAAQEYLRSFDANDDGAVDNLTGPATSPESDAYYQSLHELAARTACREARGLGGVAYTADNPGTPGTNEESCGPMPIIRTCIHDGGDTRCGQVAFGHAVPPECAALAGTMNNSMTGGSEQSRYVEVRVCYEFTTIVNMQDLQLPLNFGISVGDIWLEKDRVFGVAFYPPPPTPTPPPPPPPPPPTTAPCSIPVPSFTFTPTGGVSPLQVQFTDTSTEVDCEIESWLWDFGDGSFSTLQNPTYTYVYDEPQPSTTFAVTLTVRSAAGAAAPVSQTITVGSGSPCPDPVAVFTGTPGSGSSPLEVQFTDESQANGCPITWSWDFGDDTTASTEQNPEHVFENTTNAPVNYEVTLTVTNSEGDTDEATATITVNPATP